MKQVARNYARIPISILSGTAMKSARNSVLSAATGILLAIGTSGCASIDGFSSRADSFNASTADAKTTAIITNILRAANAEPLQFTDVSSITGQASIQGNATAGMPFPFRGGQGVPLAQQFITGSATATASANNQFTVANLNTQEFYYGLQAQIDMQLVDSYLAGGFDPAVLLPVLVSSFEIKRGDRQIVFKSDGKDPAAFFASYQALEYLIEAGLSTEKISDSKYIGPPLPSSIASDPRLLGALVSTTATDGPSLADYADKTTGKSFRLKKNSSSYRFCFDRTKSRPAVRELGAFKYFVGGPDIGPKSIYLATADLKPIKDLKLTLNDADYCGATDAQRAKADKKLSLHFGLRSVQGVIYFLGDIVRTEMGLQPDGPKSMELRNPQGGRVSLFHITAGGLGDGAQVWFHGAPYTVKIDPSGTSDHSGQILELLTELLALQSSAKNLPSSTLVTVVGQ